MGMRKSMKAPRLNGGTDHSKPFNWTFATHNLALYEEALKRYEAQQGNPAGLYIAKHVTNMQHAVRRRNSAVHDLSPFWRHVDAIKLRDGIA